MLSMNVVAWRSCHIVSATQPHDLTYNFLGADLIEQVKPSLRAPGLLS